jgi:hypothetical protein
MVLLTIGDSVKGGSSGESFVPEVDSSCEDGILPVILNDLIISSTTGSKITCVINRKVRLFE